jgi:transposase
MVTKETLKYTAKRGLRFIFRLLDPFSLSAEIKDKAWEMNQWETVDQLSSEKRAASYKLQSFSGEIDNETYRFIVVHSSVLDGRKKRKINKAVEDEKQSLSKEAKELYSREFMCEPGAKKAVELFLSEHKDTFYNLSGKAVTETIIERRNKRGRPSKDAPEPTHRVVYRARISIDSLDEDKIERLRERESTFVLITDLNDNQEYLNRFILEEYKSQSTVESKFRFIKSPYVLGPILIDKPERVEAIGYVLLMALLIAILLERRIRNNIKKEGEPIAIPGNRKTLTPTITMILDMLDTIQVLKVKVAGKMIYKLDALQGFLTYQGYFD